ncbi:hypothetical protein Tco_0607589 [Tanacetum coccineum]
MSRLDSDYTENPHGVYRCTYLQSTSVLHWQVQDEVQITSNLILEIDNTDPPSCIAISMIVNTIPPEAKSSVIDRICCSSSHKLGQGSYLWCFVVVYGGGGGRDVYVVITVTVCVDVGRGLNRCGDRL